MVKKNHASMDQESMYYVLSLETIHHTVNMYVPVCPPWSSISTHIIV